MKFYSIAKLFFAVLIAIALCPTTTLTQVYSAGTGNWNDGSTWSTFSPPQISEDVIISSGHTVTVNLSNTSALKSVVIETNSELVITGSGYIVIGNAGWGRSLTVNGTMSIENGGAITVNGAWIHIYGTVNMNSLNGAIDAAASPTYLYNGSTFNLSNGEVWTNGFTLNTGATINANGGVGFYVNGDANLSGTLTTTATFPTGHLFTITGSTTVSGSIGVGGSTLGSNYNLNSPMTLSSGSEVRYLRAGDQTIDASLNYYDLTLEGSGNKTINSAVTVYEQLTFLGTARFANYNRNVSCGSDLINNSTASHIFGCGTYTFTGTTIGGNCATVIDSATLNFSGSSVSIGDGNCGNGSITLKNVSFSNASSDLIIGAGAYTGTVTIDGLLSMTGSNATISVAGGVLAANNIAISGSNSSVTFLAGTSTHQVAGYLDCGNNLSVQTPVAVGGNVDVSGNLVVGSEFDVTGTASIGGNLSITGSSTPSVNNFGGMVTVNGPYAYITGGESAFAGGFAHNANSSGSTCVISTDYTDGSGSVATTINAENVSISSTPVFNRLVLSNASGAAYGYSDMTVKHSMSLAKDLDMTGYTLAFPQTAPLSAMSGTGEVIGTVLRTLQAPGTYTFNGAHTTLMVPTLTTAQDYQFKLGLFAPDQQAVVRCYDVNRVGSDLTPAAWEYTLGLQYRDSELNGNNENLLLMAYGTLDIAGEDQFTKLSSSTVNTSTNILTYVFDGTLSFNHRYIFGDLNAPLPVELIAFSAYRKDATVELRWETATELNNYGFEVERAADRNGPFAAIAFVEGQGTKNSPTRYSCNDSDAMHGTLYYRLRQIDRDGSVNYSDVIEVSGDAPRFGMSNYPNPFNPTTTITFVAPSDGHASMMVFNTLGECVARPYDAEVRQDETVSVYFDAADLPGGTYFYTVRIGDATQTGKMLLTK
jgi:hypothetical protein